MENNQKLPPSWPFSKPLEFLQKVKYGGAVGKLAVITVVALIVVAVGLVSAWNNQAVHLAGFGLVFLIVVMAFVWISKTLKQHPELALLDGTEYVTLQKIQLAAKNQPMIPDSPTISDPTPPLIDAPPTAQLLEAPSEEEE